MSMNVLSCEEVPADAGVRLLAGVGADVDEVAGEESPSPSKSISLLP